MKFETLYTAEEYSDLLPIDDQLLSAELRLNHPCGTHSAAADWSRDRRVSLALADQEFWLVCRGRGWMSDGHQRHELRPGVCVWMRPGGIYDAGSCPHDPLFFLFIHFESSITPTREYFQHVDLNLLETMAMRIIDSVGYPTSNSRGQPIDRTASNITLLRSCLIELCRRDRSPDAHVQQDTEIQEVAVAIRRHPADDRPIKQWARKLSLSPAHFSRRFRRETGLSPQQYRIRARIASAQQQLIESSLNVSQIAEQLGYPDVYCFSRQFRKFVGCSPSRYRDNPQL